MSHQQDTTEPRPAWVYLLALALCLVLSVDKALSDSWAFNGQNVAAFALFFYGMQGMGKRMDARGEHVEA